MNSGSSELALPALTATEMASVDRAMFTVCGLDVLQVMEVAGRAVAAWVRREMFAGNCFGKKVAVLCGSGGNGGDGLVAARHLAGWGAAPFIVLSSEPDASTPAGHNLRVARVLQIPERNPATALDETVDLILDGLLGFGGRGAPRGTAATLIDAANAHASPVVAIDIPSGLDATTGEVHDPCVRADATVTLGLPKTGLLTDAGRAVAGRLIVADIGIPDAAFRAAGIAPPAFSWQDDVVELDLP